MIHSVKCAPCCGLLTGGHGLPWGRRKALQTDCTENLKWSSTQSAVSLANFIFLLCVCHIDGFHLDIAHTCPGLSDWPSQFRLSDLPECVNVREACVCGEQLYMYRSFVLKTFLFPLSSLWWIINFCLAAYPSDTSEHGSLSTMLLNTFYQVESWWPWRQFQVSVGSCPHSAALHLNIVSPSNSSFTA